MMINNDDRKSNSTVAADEPLHCQVNELSKADPPEYLSAIDKAPRVTEGRGLSWAEGRTALQY